MCELVSGQVSSLLEKCVCPVSSSQQDQMRMLVLAMAMLCGGALPRLPAQEAGLEEKSSSIHGTVVNSVTQEPIGRALVSSPDNRLATMTDDQGRFEFVLARPEPSQQKSVQSGGSLNEGTSGPVQDAGNSQVIQLTARKPGFLDDEPRAQRSVSVPQGQNDVTLSLTPESLIIGRVVVPDEADQILVDVYRRQVQEGRAQWAPMGSALAKSNGEFRFAGLRAGKYKLLTHELLDRDPLTFDPNGQMYGYPPVYFPSDLASEGAIDLATGGTFQASLTPVRQPYYQVRVPVPNVAPGMPTQVVVSQQGHHGPGFSLGYNQQEQRIEGLLPDGSYTIEARTYGTPATAGSVNLTVKGGATPGPVMVLTPGSPVAVNVKEEFTSPEDSAGGGAHIIDSGTNGGRNFRLKGPRSYLNLTLWPADDFSLENVVGLAPPSGPGDESLVIADVQPGRYWVQINSSRGFPAAITSGGNDLLHHPLVVGWGGTVSPIEITMRDDWAQIETKLDRAEGSSSRTPAIPGVGSATETAPPTWVCLVPMPDSSGQFQQTWISPAGESGDRQIAPGEYRVLAFDHQQQELEYRNPEAMRAYDGKGVVVHLVPGQKERVTVPLLSTGESQ